VTIPVRNIYFMLLYAWNHFQGGPVTDIGQDQSPDLPTLLAKVLNAGTHRLLRRGVDRGYRQALEHTRSPRGRLMLDHMIKQQTMMRGVAVCEVDELTPDVLHNRILRSTLITLSDCTDLSSDLRHELRMTARRFTEVTHIRLTADLFHRVQLSRNTAQYGLLMHVCEFVFSSMMPDEAGTGTKFQSVLRDEVRMSTLFEDFLRNFYRAGFAHCTVGSQVMTWDTGGGVATNSALLPVMQTDITVRSPSRTVIIDAKYYAQTLATGRFGQRLRSAHLYQLSTYLAHEERRSGRQVAGMLIYPLTSIALEEQFTLLGHSVTVATVDLSMPWPHIAERLTALLDTQLAA